MDNKRIIIVHQWGSGPEGDWYPWLKKQFELRGYGVVVPKMPNPDSPDIDDWIRVIEREVIEPNEDVILVGHSVGAQAILRYVAGLKEKQKLGELVLVAPWFSLTNLSPEEEKIAKPWLKTPIDFESVKAHTKEITAIFSSNDPYVPLKENLDICETKLGAETIVEGDMGHFTAEDGITKLPLILETLIY